LASNLARLRGVQHFGKLRKGESVMSYLQELQRRVAVALKKYRLKRPAFDTSWVDIGIAWADWCERRGPAILRRERLKAQ